MELGYLSTAFYLFLCFFLFLKPKTLYRSYAWETKGYIFTFKGYIFTLLRLHFYP